MPKLSKKTSKKEITKNIQYQKRKNFNFGILTIKNNVIKKLEKKIWPNKKI